MLKLDVTRLKEEGEIKGSRWTGGSPEIRSISVYNVRVFYLVCLLLSWEHHVS